MHDNASDPARGRLIVLKNLPIMLNSKHFFVITLIMMQCCPTHFSACMLYRPPHDAHSNYFINKIFAISRLITKFTKILCHENLELYIYGMRNLQV